ncbi:zinc ribbon domain-containing protein [Methanococcoides sp. SA1]|nr:zinc ribbon domain-containing protein [Methanococcoides sp. SA1]
MRLSTQTLKVAELVESNPNLIKGEKIIDGITGTLAIIGARTEAFSPIFKMNYWAYDMPVVFLLTQTRIIMYYADKEGKHQFRMYPLDIVENIVLSHAGTIIKTSILQIYIKGAAISISYSMGEGPDEFVQNAKRCMEPQTTDDCIFCMQCGTKLPAWAAFCMKCGVKL